MAATSQYSPAVKRTEHPYIVRVDSICGGRAIIEGSRVSVRHIAQLYKAGDTVDEVLQAHSHLKAAAVYDAISYYLDHQAEIEQEIAENRFEAVQDRAGLVVDARGVVTFPQEG
jgi:uncharacterized protein (DUF433 family)